MIHKKRNEMPPIRQKRNIWKNIRLNLRPRKRLCCAIRTTFSMRWPERVAWIPPIWSTGLLVTFWNRKRLWFRLREPLAVVGMHNKKRKTKRMNHRAIHQLICLPPLPLCNKHRSHSGFRLPRRRKDWMPKK